MVALKICAAIAFTALLAWHVTPVTATERWHGSTLKNVYPMAQGDFVIIFDSDSSACTNVNSPKYMYVAVGENGVTADGAQKIYAAALAALLTGKTVTIAFDDGTAYCYVNRLAINK